MSDNEIDINSGFVDRLRAELRADVADVTAPPTLLAGVRRGYARRRAVHRLAMVATPVAVVAAVGAGVLASAPPTTTQRPVATVDAAYVTARTDQALLGVADDVLYEHATAPGGDQWSKPGQTEVLDHWVTADRSALRARITVNGAVVTDASFGPNGGADVNYGSRTWLPTSRQSRPLDAPAALTPEEIRQGLAAGGIRVVGPGESINGHATVLLHRDQVPGSEPVDLWVDRSTYLPVRYRIDDVQATVYSMTWLPPTQQNLALLNAPVPNGFERG